MSEFRSTQTPTLAIAFADHGPPDGPPVVLLHGFPYAPQSYDAVVPPLVAAGRRVIVPCGSTLPVAPRARPARS